MKISLIEPRSPDYHVYSGLAIPRLGLPILATELREQGHDVRVYVEDVADFTPQTAWEVMRSDLVGLSLISSTAPRGYAMARLLGLREVPVVFGGAHPTFMPEEPLQYGDYVLRGEAENSMLRLVEALEGEGELSEVPNLVYRRGDEIVHTPREKECPDLDHVPVPDLSLIEGHENLKIIPAMTTRGCPHRCSFCCVSGMFGQRYRMASIDRVAEEAKRWEGRNVFFCDDNFTAVPERTKELLDRLLTLGRVPRRWHAQVRADTYEDPELMELLQRTNCKRVFVGYESINQKVLDDYNKHQTVEDVRRSVRGFHDYDIPVHGMFMFGADHDDEETFKKTMGFALDNRIDTVQFLVLTPVPGTALFKQMEEQDRIITRDWSLYDGHHVVFEPARMSPLALQMGTIRANRRFYSPCSVLRSLSSFRLTTAMLRYWGGRVLKGWHQTNSDFMRKLRSWQKSGREFPRKFTLKLKGLERELFGKSAPKYDQD